MRCELFEELIPLHVGGDLEPHDADDLRRHLTGCAKCRQLNEEFQASQNWLTAYAVPDFDDASLAKMRASTMSEIERQEKRGSFIDWLLPKLSPRPKWNPGLMLASAAIALAVVSGLVAAVYRQQVAPTKTGGEVIADSNRLSDATGKAPDDVQFSPPTSGRVSAATSRERGLPRSVREELPPEALNNGGSLNPLEPPVIPPGEPTTEPVVAPVTPPVLVEPEEKEMLRIELQTADPNIRIIWLTPKTGSPSNPKQK
ncbi:MAG: zf-HC2 domain-containing protein [Blastocatellia bacterium]